MLVIVGYVQQLLFLLGVLGIGATAVVCHRLDRFAKISPLLYHMTKRQRQVMDWAAWARATGWVVLGAGAALYFAFRGTAVLLAAVVMVEAGFVARISFGNMRAHMKLQNAVLPWAECGPEELTAMLKGYFAQPGKPLKVIANRDGVRLVIELEDRCYAIRPRKGLTPTMLLGSLIMAFGPRLYGLDFEQVHGDVLCVVRADAPQESVA